MRYWWVNHNQTFRHEFGGHYIWSPKRKRDGSRNRFYDFLREAQPGDVVFSFADTLIQGAGFAVSFCYTCPRPAEFGHIGESWDTIGWRVDVNFVPFTNRPRPKDHLDILRPILDREPFAPLRLTGDGLQHIYLTSITPALAQAILSLADSTASAFASEIAQDTPRILAESELTGQQEWEDIEQRRIAQAPVSETTRQALVRARIGQGLFKERVSTIETACRITFVTNPAHLIASHIKPWRESTNEERLHAGNGLLLTPSVDHLFDRGFITFDDSGEVVISPVADRVSLKRMGLDPAAPPRPTPFNSDQRHFLSHHRDQIFLSAAHLKP